MTLRGVSVYFSWQRKRNPRGKSIFLLAVSRGFQRGKTESPFGVFSLGLHPVSLARRKRNGVDDAGMEGLHQLKSQLTKQKEETIMNIEKGAAGKRLAPHVFIEVIAELSEGAGGYFFFA